MKAPLATYYRCLYLSQLLLMDFDLTCRFSPLQSNIEALVSIGQGTAKHDVSFTCREENEELSRKKVRVANTACTTTAKSCIIECHTYSAYTHFRMTLFCILCCSTHRTTSRMFCCSPETDLWHPKQTGEGKTAIDALLRRQHRPVDPAILHVRYHLKTWLLSLHEQQFLP